ncbi:MAG: hypothetical protein JNM22_05550 [Saprospiraceae bacterium]|nr:hypothetical protein [Saprospiraceae bacterium]
MSLNFKKIQEKYPDALKLTINLKKGAAPFSEQTLKAIVGGGRTLFFRTSERSQTIVCSKLAEAEVQKTAHTL